MQVTLIEKGYISTIELPEKANGQYWIEKLNSQGAPERAFSVEGIDNSWVLKAGRRTFILNDDLRECKESPLTAGALIRVGFRKTSESAYILVTNYQKKDLMFHKLVVAPGSQFTIGSAPECDIVLNHSMIAPQHCALMYQDNTFFLQSSDEQRGVYLNSDRAEPAQLRPGDVLFMMGVSVIIGSNFIAVNHPALITKSNNNIFTKYEKQFEYTEVVEGFFDDERVESIFFRSPRFKRDISTYSLRLDSPPGKKKPDETPAILVIGPAMTMATSSTVMATFTVMNNLSSGRSMSSSIPTLVMAGAMIASSMLWPTLSRKYRNKQTIKEEKIRKKKYYAYLDRVRAELARQADIQAEILRENHVILPVCVERIEKQERNLWERMPEHNDFLVVRIGNGDLPLDMQFNKPDDNFTVEEDELRDAMLLLANEPKLVKNSPIPHSLVTSYITGVTGERAETDIFIRNMLLQMAALHSYTDLKIAFLYDEEEEEIWSWVRWLPHVWNRDETIRFVASNDDELKVVNSYFEQILNNRESGMPPERYVIFSTSRTFAKKAEMINQLLLIPGYIGFSLILEYNELRHLPKECKTVIDVAGENSKVFDRTDITGWSQPFLPEYHAEISARDVAVMLANIKLDQSDKAFALPGMMTFLEMCKVDRIEHLNPLEKWKQNNPVNSLQAPIGVTTKGDYFYLDLHEKYHGPHGLIAGMTGSGKSEFIMTFILSLALNYHPHEVAFILIDYKGGGMANAFANLPHLAGTITNLDGAAITRSLVSIESELKRRQAIFSKTSEEVDISNIDIYKYQKLYREGVVKEPLQHLFIISDEFAELKTQEPEFMAQLVSAARIGRSLGIHLILATQKPSGVVDDQIWSNSRFRIALKVQSEADSNDMIKKPLAAALVEKGRFYVQVGFDEIFELGQSAWSGAPYLPDGGAVESVDDKVVFIDRLGRRVREFSPTQAAAPVVQEKNPPKQLDEITKYIEALAKEEGIFIRPLWLEPIKPVILLDEVAEKYAYKSEPYSFKPVIGEYDIPAQQSQNIFTIDIMSTGNILLYGSAGSGKTIFLVTLITSLIKHHTSQEINMYIMDFESETLRCFSKAPQVGDVVLISETEKITNLFKMIDDTIEIRKKLYADYGGSYDSYLHQGGKDPCMLILMHNYPVFAEAFEDMAFEDLVQLTRDCTKYGVYFLLTTSGVSDIRYKLSQNFAGMYSMQMNDQDDYNFIFGGNEKVYPGKHPGRGVLKLDSNLFEFQTAYIAEPDQIFTHAQLLSAQLLESSEYPGAPAVPVLPEVCDSAYMAEYLDDSDAIPVGVDCDSLQIVRSSFGQFMNIVASDMADGSFVLQGIAELYYKKGYDIAVMDNLESFYGMPKYKYVTAHREKKEMLEEFCLTLHSRHTAYKEALENNTPSPVFDEKIYFFNDLMGAMKGLDDVTRTNLEMSLLHGKREYNLRVILGVSGIKEYSREDWFSQQASNDTMVWVGYGISDAYFVRIINTTRALSQAIPDDFGYVLERGKQRKCKLVLAEGYRPYEV